MHSLHKFQVVTLVFCYCNYNVHVLLQCKTKKSFLLFDRRNGLSNRRVSDVACDSPANHHVRAAHAYHEILWRRVLSLSNLTLRFSSIATPSLQEISTTWYLDPILLVWLIAGLFLVDSNMPLIHLHPAIVGLGTTFRPGSNTWC